MEQKFLRPSLNPVEDIKKMSYEGQDPLRRMYKAGYESYLSMMPSLDPSDRDFSVKLDISKDVMQMVHDSLHSAPWVYNEFVPTAGNFNRTIIALEPPTVSEDGAITAGSEIVVTRWGDGFVAPPHGHREGLMYEQVLSGMFRDTTYRVTDEDNRVVRPVRTKVFTTGDVMSDEYFTKPSNLKDENTAVVHGFKSIGFSVGLHYVSSHPTDGRRHTYHVEYFDDVYNYQNADLRRISSKDGMYLKTGSVILVRSSNVPEYEDHYMVVTGKPVMKRHGLRPQEFSIEAPRNKVLDKYDMEMGLTLLQLQPDAEKAFHEFHGLKF